MQDESRIKWQYTAEDNQLVLNSLYKMIKLYVHYTYCFMFVHLHKVLIKKASFVHKCPGCSSGSTLSFLGCNQSLWGRSQGGNLQVGQTWQSLWQSAASGAGEERPWAVPRIKQQSLGSVLTKEQPHWGFSFSVCSWGMQCVSSPCLPGAFPWEEMQRAAVQMLAWVLG